MPVVASFRISHLTASSVRCLLAVMLLAASACPVAFAQSQAVAARPTTEDVLKASSASDWRELDPENTLYLDFAAGRVVIELAPAFAPHHVANIKMLVREGYFDGLAFIRAQDNYVVQWGDPTETRPIRTAKKTLPQEFSAQIVDGMPFTLLPDRDTYAPQVGYSGSFPTARDPWNGRTWLTHCYGMVGAARDVDADSGGGTELYAIIGQAPRQLDRNITLVGRVMQGMELLSTLPRGSGAKGFYDKPAQNVPIKAIRVAADVPPAERTRLEVIRTDTPTFKAIVESMRFRGGDWNKVAAEHVELCNVPIAVRLKQ